MDNQFSNLITNLFGARGAESNARKAINGRRITEIQTDAQLSELEERARARLSHPASYRPPSRPRAEINLTDPPKTTDTGTVRLTSARH